MRALEVICGSERVVGETTGRERKGEKLRGWMRKVHVKERKGKKCEEG